MKEAGEVKLRTIYIYICIYICGRGGRGDAWPEQAIFITNIVWCLAHKRGVEGGPYIARYYL